MIWMQTWTMGHHHGEEAGVRPGEVVDKGVVEEDDLMVVEGAAEQDMLASRTMSWRSDGA
jgi:hypothetical protein